MSEGELLIGDGVTQGIVRIGDTVRRPLRPFSLTVRAYLAHLRDAGFTGAPLPFGVDEQGREVLSFVPGDVPRNPLPPETAGDEVLVALADPYAARGVGRVGAAARRGLGGTPASAGRPITRRTELRPPGSTTSRTRCGTGRRCAIRGTGRPRLRAPTSRTGSRCSRTPTARHRAELAPFAVDMARRYHEDSRVSAELDPVFRKLWEDGAKDELPRAEAWLREAAPGDHRSPRPARPGRPRRHPELGAPASDGA